MINPKRAVFRPDLVIPAIYDAAMDPSGWIGVVERIRLGLHGSSAQLHSPGVMPEQGGIAASAQHSLEDARAYAKACAELGHVWNDVWLALGKREGCFTGDGFLPRKEFKRSAIFNEFFRQRDVHNSCMAILHNGEEPGVPATVFGVNRGPRAEPFSPAEQRNMAALIPHFRHALRLSRLVTVEQAKFQASVTLLERSSAAIAMVSRSQHIVYLTPKAKTLLATQDGLAIRTGRLVACRPADAAALERVVSRTAANGTSLASGGVIAIKRPSLRRPYWVTVLPVPADPFRSVAPEAPVAMVVMQSDEDLPRAPFTQLAEQHKLTPAEFGVLRMLVEGNSRSDIADRMGITVRTVRMHLAHLFVKMDAKRQPDLIRLALSSMVSLDLTP